MIDIQKYKRENLHALVVDYLKHKIITGEYKEGDHILESVVAEELGISRAPVREGIRELENQGLIKSIPRKGNYVATLTVEDLKEIFDIRILLEDYILEKIITEDKLTAEDYKKLTDLVDEMVKIAQQEGEISSRIVGVNEKDIEFHTYLWNKSGSYRTVKMLKDLHFQLQLAMVIDTKLTDDLEVTARDHYEMLEKLKNKDLAGCLTALKNSIVTYKLFGDPSKEK